MPCYAPLRRRLVILALPCALIIGSESLWSPLGYATGGSYAFKDALPKRDEVLLLFDKMATDDWWGNVAYQQAKVVTRADFGRPGHPSFRVKPTAAAFHEAQSLARWRLWWEQNGKALAAASELAPDAAAWALVDMNGTMTAPSAPSLPSAWTMRTAFHTGDYGGKVDEAIVIRHDRDGSSIIRILRVGTSGWPRKAGEYDGRLRWERWTGNEASTVERLARAAVYACDHPWLVYTPQAGVGKPFGEPILGRHWPLYYEGATWSLADARGRTIWNARHAHWRDDGKPAEVGATFDSVGGVYRLLCRSLPDGEGWTRLDLPDDAVLAWACEELVLRDPLIPGGPGERILDATETLRLHGRKVHIAPMQAARTAWTAYVGHHKTIPAELQALWPSVAVADQVLARLAEAMTAITGRDP